MNCTSIVVLQIVNAEPSKSHICFGFTGHLHVYRYDKKSVIYPCVRCSYGELDVHPFVLAGKIGDRPSGIYPQPDTTEFPTEDILLIAMERVTVLFDRYVQKQFYILQ